MRTLEPFTRRRLSSHKGVHTAFARLTKDEPRIDTKLRRFLPQSFNMKAVADYELGPDAVIPPEQAAALSKRHSASSRALRDCWGDLVIGGAPKGLAAAPPLGKVARVLRPGCDATSVDFAHLRSCANAGTGQKPHDFFGVSLCRRHHVEQHSLGVDTFDRKYGIDLWALAAEFARRSPDADMRAALKLVRAEELANA